MFVQDIAGEVFDKAELGDDISVMDLCESAAFALEKTGAIENARLREFVIEKLRLVSEGNPPMAVFYPRAPNRPKSYNRLEEWEAKMEVLELMGKGMSLSKACEAAALESGGSVNMSISRIKKICRGLRADTDLPFPDDLFPIESLPDNRKRREKLKG